MLAAIPEQDFVRPILKRNQEAPSCVHFPHGRTRAAIQRRAKNAIEFMDAQPLRKRVVRVLGKLSERSLDSLLLLRRQVRIGAEKQAGTREVHSSNPSTLLSMVAVIIEIQNQCVHRVESLNSAGCDVCVCLACSVAFDGH